MADEYIRKQDAVHTILGQPPDAHYPAWYAAQIASLEPADVAPVVRCRDCKFHDNDDFCTGRGFPYQLVPDDGFCDKGKRKE